MSQPICWHCAAGVQLFKRCQNLSADCVAGVQMFNRCGNLSAGTVLKVCSCLSGVTTYLPALFAGVQLFKRCQNLSADCVAGVQMFNRCGNLSAGTVMQGCSCLSIVETYLPALCCRGAAS